MTEPQILKVSPTRINNAIASLAHCTPEGIPLLRAMRDHGAIYAHVMPGMTSPAIDEALLRRPGIFIIGDDMPVGSNGPADFDLTTLKYFFGLAKLVVVHAGNRGVEAYQLCADRAVARSECVVMIETAASRVESWLRFNRRHGVRDKRKVLVMLPHLNEATAPTRSQYNA